MIDRSERRISNENGSRSATARERAAFLARKDSVRFEGNPERAFTLIETLVAVAVFTLAIVAPFTAASGSLRSAGIARDGVIATGLAAEGVEYVRAIRDNNYLANPASYQPLNGLNGTGGPDCRAPAACTIDPSQPFGGANAVHRCTGATCSEVPLYVSGAGLYNQQRVGTASYFSRAVSVTQNPNGQAGVERATVTVTWVSRGTSRTEVLTEDFYDWL